MGTNEQLRSGSGDDRDGTGHGDVAWVLPWSAVDAGSVGAVGGKGAQLGVLSRIDGITVPAGYCVTTAAFRRGVELVPKIRGQLDRLAKLPPDDQASRESLGAELRRSIEEATMPSEIEAAIRGALADLGADAPYAVRSSATAEDSPAASFAGQHDSHLNVVGATEVVAHVLRVWASLFTERAVAYRHQAGVGHHEVQMAVVVQRMAVPDAAGVLFTADPVTSDRTMSSVEVVPGLGESLVSGRLTPDVYAVRGDDIVDRTITSQPFAIRALPGGGTREQPEPPELAPEPRPVITDEHVVRIARIGRRIEAHLGAPQDIEWCLVGDDIVIVQSRPITTLYPIPASADDARHVYVSTGHQQMMTDALKPLGISVWQRTAMAPMHVAGSRMFVDVARALASPSSRAAVLTALGTSDPLIGDALRTLIERPGFLPPSPDEAATDGGEDRVAGDPEERGDRYASAARAGAGAGAGRTARADASGPARPAPAELDPGVVQRLEARGAASIDALERAIQQLSGPELVAFIEADFAELKRIVFDPEGLQIITAAAEAAAWLDEQLETWLGEPAVADTLIQSVPGNVTSEMGLALLDVADAIRPHPAVVELLRGLDEGDDLMAALDGVAGGAQARDAITGFLARYGMRCVGEIDLTRPRWSERPSTLVPMLLANVDHFEAGAGRRRFEAGERQAAEKARDVVARVRALPDGERRAEETGRMIGRLRAFSGFREFPKYVIVSRYALYKAAMLREAARLVEAGLLADPDDLSFLTLEEIGEVAGGQVADAALLAERREAFRRHRSLTPPRVLTSDGEALSGAYRRDDVPAGAMTGLAVSAGDVEGRARVILDLAEAQLEPGDILVTRFTDPSWTPVFVAAAGLVTEVGGRMTHGAVIAREYGLPAVVGVEHATRLIRDGQRIRVHGTQGYVEVLDRPSGR